MEITYDPDADAMYIQLRKGKFAKNKVVDRITILDLDKRGRVYGIELLDVRRRTDVRSLHRLKVRYLTGPTKSIELKGLELKDILKLTA